MTFTRDSKRRRFIGPGLVAVLVAIIAGAPSAAMADVKLPAIFGSHMVLQRDQKDRVWGWAEPGRGGHGQDRRPDQDRPRPAPTASGRSRSTRCRPAARTR